MFDLEDDTDIFIKSIIETLIIVVFSLILFGVVGFNYHIGVLLADKMKIPYDLALSFTSIGFVNNVTFVLSILELIIFCLICNFIVKKIKF